MAFDASNKNLFPSNFHFSSTADALIEFRYLQRKQTQFIDTKLDKERHHKPP